MKGLHQTDFVYYGLKVKNIRKDKSTKRERQKDKLDVV